MAATTVKLPVTGKGQPLVLAVVQVLKAAGQQVEVVPNTTAGATEVVINGASAGTALEAAKQLAAAAAGAKLLGDGADGSAAAVEQWLASAKGELASTDFGTFAAAVDKLAEYLRLRSYLVGYSLTLADIAVADSLRSTALWRTMTKAPGAEERLRTVLRWLAFVEAHAPVKEAAAVLAALQKATRDETKAKDQGSFEINLPGAEVGKVVTRFPPEPSGYLHIGHAKAALLNDYFARQYKGKLIVRFDDTNPSKEKEEFEHAILEDLKLLNIVDYQVTYTSDSFDKILDCAESLIRAGKAYVDDTPVDQMREERLKCIESKARGRTVEENLKLWEEMKQGSELGKRCCLRAKINMKSKNGALRDPVMYRCNDTPHNRTKTKYKLYPTYDFACPIVDSLEGVTHALRTTEYHDRNDQYNWFIDALGIRKPHIWDYSRINFVYTLLSKRKLTWFVETGRVTGWDDPRFPTIRGILRRGMTVDALREYILMQGASKNVLLLEWDKIWAVNRRIIDPKAPRYTAIQDATKVPFVLSNGPAAPYTAEVARHKKNPELGTKPVTYSSTVYLEGDDATAIAADEEVTLMDWGNAIARTIVRDDAGRVTEIRGELHLEGDFKKTKKKLTWLSAHAPQLKVVLMDYDYLITKKKLEEEDTFENFLNEKTEFRADALADRHLSVVKKGDIIQFERRGFFICDAVGADGTLTMIAIPDAKQSAAPAIKA